MNSLELGKEIFKNKSKLCSNSPGVYQVFDGKNKIIYVGKAKNLPKRLSNYSSSSTQPITSSTQARTSSTRPITTSKQHWADSAGRTYSCKQRDS